MDEKYRALIKNEFISCVKGTISRMKKGDTNRPFHEALLSKDVILWSRFERSFSTSFGQKSIEEISRLAALSGGASDAKRQKNTVFEIDTGVLAAINNVNADRKNKHPNWNESLRYVETATRSGIMMEISVISDLWWKKDGVDNYMSIKTVQPNIDQTSIAKEHCLKLKVNDNRCNVFFGLYYNPYGDEREDYCFSPPMSVFDMHLDPVVLIGEDYWDTLGGPGFYEELLDLAESVGDETKAMLSGYSEGQTNLGRFD